MPNDTYACSPKLELNGLPYFPRLCDKIRLHATSQLHTALHENLGSGMDLWMCQFLGVSYEQLKARILAGDSDETALAWAKANGTPRDELQTKWFQAYLKTRGFRDDLATRLAQRIEENGFQNRTDILTFMDYIDADEGRA